MLEIRRRRSRIAGVVAFVAMLFGSPSLGGAYRCCHAGHGGVVAHADRDVMHCGPTARVAMPMGGMPGDQAPAHDAKPCDCVGPCNGAVAAAVIVPAHVLPGGTVTAIPAPVFSPPALALDYRGSFFLPYANAPPVR